MTNFDKELKTKGKFLLVIDLQTGYPKNISEDLIKKIKSIESKFTEVFKVIYENNESTPVVREFDWKYLMKGQTKLVPGFEMCNCFIKSTYSATTKQIMSYIDLRGMEEIYLCGVYTDACVLATAYDLFDRGVRVKVIEDCCASITTELHEAALMLLRRNAGTILSSDI